MLSSHFCFVCLNWKYEHGGSNTNLPETIISYRQEGRIKKLIVLSAFRKLQWSIDMDFKTEENDEEVPLQHM